VRPRAWCARGAHISSPSRPPPPQLDPPPEWRTPAAAAPPEAAATSSPPSGSGTTRCGRRRITLCSRARTTSPHSPPPAPHSPPPPSPPQKQDDASGPESEEEEEEEEEDPLVALRKRAVRQNPDYVAKAHDCIRIAVAPAPLLLLHLPPPPPSAAAAAAGAPLAPLTFAPLFVHQGFPGEVVFGYKDARISVSYTDPDLRMAVVGSASAVKTDAAVPAPDMSGRLIRVAPDALPSCLRAASAIPESFPNEALLTRLGPAAASAPLSAHNFVPAAAAASNAPAFAPYGERVDAYTVGDRRFVLHKWPIASSPATRAYHERMATLASWLIETASSIDTADERWTCFGLYEETAAKGEQEEAPSFFFAGYATVYRFTNPVRRSRPEALRLAQLLLLPRFQRAGHGRRILRAVHAEADRIDAHEVTVESPCEGMARLRDSVDVERAHELGAIANLLPPGRAGGEGGAGSQAPAAPAGDAGLSLVRDWTDKDVEPLRSALRITSAQAHRAAEATLLGRLRAAAPAPAPELAAAAPVPVSAALPEAVARAYRLCVKRRLLAGSADLRSLPDPEARKVVLEDRYRECEAAYALALQGQQGMGGRPTVPREEAAASLEAWRRREAEIAAEHDKGGRGRGKGDGTS
jgi:GNAT superfamily N-acetyltransferase